MRFRQLVLAVSLFGCSPPLSAEGSAGTQVYAKTHGAVFLIYLTDAKGKSVALGSGFLVAPRTIATNAHVANAGRPVIAVGDIRIPAKVIRVDTEHDLALLSVDVDITSDPLVLSSAKVEVGEEVYAIGNPEGLENTFSQGIVSADRTSEKESLIQITNPISHGSSGGPVIDQNGQVVGVAVAFLGEGQNLNFAVPARYLDALIHGPTSAVPASADAKSALDKALSIRDALDKEEYSDEATSAWQVKNKEIGAMLNIALDSDDPSILTRLARSFSSIDNQASVRAAERAFNMENSAKTSDALVNALLWKAIFLGKEDASYEETLARASSIGEPWIQTGKNPSSSILSNMAFVTELQGQNSEALHLYLRALNAPTDEWSPTRYTVLLGLFRNSAAVKDTAQRRKWFGQLVQTGHADAEDLTTEAGYLDDEGDLKGATELYEQAAPLSKVGGEWCTAAVGRGIQGAIDETLADGRECLSRQEKIQENSKVSLDDIFANVNMYMARALNSRGVYTEALNHAREATKLDPKNGNAYDEMGDALYSLQRYEECVSAESEAIRLTDGKFGFMHFRLGTAYFSLEQWKSAETEFETASRMNPKDDTSTYDVALSLARQGFFKDAIPWYEETLRRNPTTKDREEIMKRIQELRQQ